MIVLEPIEETDEISPKAILHYALCRNFLTLKKEHPRNNKMLTVFIVI